MSVHVFGIRHHGPGSARSLREALTALQPDAVLIEGPPDADKLIALAGHPDMQPPVALLVYNPQQPSQAGWYPFAVFSPEWQAMQYALAQGIHVQFMDLPQKHMLALPSPFANLPPLQPPLSADMLLRLDPLRALAEAAGYSDSERWWEQMFEERRDSSQLFEAILEAMTSLRAEIDGQPSPIPGYDEREARREAWMRKTIRAASRKYKKIAVVCGAWHAPALTTPNPDDDALLKDLPSVTTRATWAPWTYGRLSRDSGYGAGIVSPGWYHHLWNSRAEDATAHWLSRVAGLLRSEDLSASPAQVIDAVRLAETLAALRGRPAPGLDELNEAAQTVLCGGDRTPLSLIHRKLIVGETLGSVPEETPAVPLQQDLESQQKRLRLKPSVDEKLIDLDLRTPNDLNRSHLLHRLSLLGIPWGQREKAQTQAQGTFHEYWRLRWQPELTIAVIEASIWGNTVADAATSKARDTADSMATLPALTALVEHVLHADLTDAVDYVMTRLQDQAALTSDTALLMDALPPLVDVVRYGNVRKTDATMVERVIDGLVTRVCIGFVPACVGLDEDAAAAMMLRLIAFNGAVRLLNRPDYTALWLDTLHSAAQRDGLPGLIAGRIARLLYDAQAISSDEVVTALGLALSPGTTPAEAAYFIEGFLRGSGAVVLHDDRLWQLLDVWLSDLPADRFEEILPLLRRTFATFHGPERRQMGERAKQGQRIPTRDADRIDVARAAKVLPILARLMGVEVEHDVIPQ
jgi:hypothetical protein